MKVEAEKASDRAKTVEAVNDAIKKTLTIPIISETQTSPPPMVLPQAILSPQPTCNSPMVFCSPSNNNNPFSSTISPMVSHAHQNTHAGSINNNNSEMSLVIQNNTSYLEGILSNMMKKQQTSTDRLEALVTDMNGTLAEHGRMFKRMHDALKMCIDQIQLLQDVVDSTASASQYGDSVQGHPLNELRDILIPSQLVSTGFHDIVMTNEDGDAKVKQTEEFLMDINLNTLRCVSSKLGVSAPARKTRRENVDEILEILRNL